MRGRLSGPDRQYSIEQKDALMAPGREIPMTERLNRMAEVTADLLCEKHMVSLGSRVNLLFLVSSSLLHYPLTLYMFLSEEGMGWLLGTEKESPIACPGP